MSRNVRLLIVLCGVVIVAMGLVVWQQGRSTTLPKPEPLPAEVAETAVTTLPLMGVASEAKAELSSLAWYGDNLILLPQYPSRYDNTLFVLSKADILAVLDGSRQTLVPDTITLDATKLEALAGFEGLEAIVFDEDKVYVTVEASPASGMLAYVVAGTIDMAQRAIHLDGDNLVKVEAQADISNASYETLLVVEGGVVTLYEDNGANVNPSPKAHRFAPDLSEMGTIPFANIEYRLTDATALDEVNRFWALNYIFPGSIAKVDPIPDPLAITYGMGATHAQYNVVERLVEFEYKEDGIILTDSPPIPLLLLGDDNSRNWEGVVRLDERGFLIVTDKFPETILAFVPAS